MTVPSISERLEQLLADDRELYEQLCDAGFVPRSEGELSVDHLETARIVRTLVQELEVNWPGVEVVLRLRTELVETRRQVHELSAVVRSLQGKDTKPPRS
jgi:hypothetical protein